MNFDEKKSRELKRVNLEIVHRIMYSLIHDGPSKKTAIARRINRNYDFFIRYLNFLEMLDFIQKENVNGVEMIYLNDRGRSFYICRFSNVPKQSIKKSLRKTLI